MTTQLLTPTDDTTHYQAVLQTLIDQGAIAARIHAHATAATPDSALPEVTVAFDRTARAVRRCIALARHIAAAPVASAAAPATRTAARTRLIRDVEDAIHRKRRHEEETDVEALCAELTERLDDPELDLDPQDRPVDDVIEDICRDLGVTMQGRSYVWPRRTPRDIADLRERAAKPPGQAATPGLVQATRPKPT